MPVPTHKEQVKFLLNLQRLLAEGTFTATYKYALLLSLADITADRKKLAFGGHPAMADSAAEQQQRVWTRSGIVRLRRQSSNTAATAGGVLEWRRAKGGDSRVPLTVNRHRGPYATFPGDP